MIDFDVFPYCRRFLRRAQPLYGQLPYILVLNSLLLEASWMLRNAFSLLGGGRLMWKGSVMKRVMTDLFILVLVGHLFISSFIVVLPLKLVFFASPVVVLFFALFGLGGEKTPQFGF